MGCFGRKIELVCVRIGLLYICYKDIYIKLPLFKSHLDKRWFGTDRYILCGSARYAGANARKGCHPRHRTVEEGTPLLLLATAAPASRNGGRRPHRCRSKGLQSQAGRSHATPLVRRGQGHHRGLPLGRQWCRCRLASKSIECES